MKLKCGPKPKPILERIRKRLRKMPSGCWEYQGFRDRDGYGKIWKCAVGNSVAAHRAMWEEVCGPIPPGMFVCHSCDNPPCCNPDHLFAGTLVDNEADKKAKGRQAKGEGHGRAKLTEENVRAILADDRSQEKVAATHDVHRSLISLIRRGLVWQEITRCS